MLLLPVMVEMVVGMGLAVVVLLLVMVVVVQWRRFIGGGEL